MDARYLTDSRTILLRASRHIDPQRHKWPDSNLHTMILRERNCTYQLYTGALLPAFAHAALKSVGFPSKHTRLKPQLTSGPHEYNLIQQPPVSYNLDFTETSPLLFSCGSFHVGEREVLFSWKTSFENFVGKKRHFAWLMMLGQFFQVVENNIFFWESSPG